MLVVGKNKTGKGKEGEIYYLELLLKLGKMFDIHVVE
jgi:hypothetical protein